MDVNGAKALVIEAGKELVRQKLIARTWGNVSCRISESKFAITPSGKAYETLNPEDIVVVTLPGMVFEGHLKPSSETGIHAAVYQIRPRINFIIHTHQVDASLVGSIYSKDDGPVKGIVVDQDASIGAFVVSNYGLPGSRRLRKALIETLKKTTSKAIIMAHHGALCMGESYEEAMSLAMKLEADCGNYIKGLKLEVADPQTAKYNLLNSHRGPRGFAVFEKIIDGKSDDIEEDSQKMLHQLIYNKRKDISAIIHASDPAIVKSSERGAVIKPFLDDVAQLIGTTVRTSFWDPIHPEESSKKIMSALKGRHAVLISGTGALCCGKTLKDAEAVQLVLIKGCMASNLAQDLGISEPIHPWECFLMRQNYLRVYAKKAGDAYKD